MTRMCGGGRCVRDHGACSGDPWKSVVSSRLNPSNFQVPCPRDDDVTAAAAANDYRPALVSYLGGFAMSAFVSYPEGGGGVNASITGFTAEETCLPGSFSYVIGHGLPPCRPCPLGTYSDVS